MKRIVKNATERREEIITASKELFLKKEYEKTTMQDIINQLNIAKGTIYHYFKSKEELLEAVILQMVDEYMKKIEITLANSQGKALEKFHILVSSGRIPNAESEMMRDLHQPGNIEMHTRLLAVTITRLAPVYAQLILQGCEEKVFKTKFPLECAEFILAGIQFLTDEGCSSWNKGDIERRIKAFPTLIENLLNAQKGSFNFLFE